MTDPSFGGLLLKAAVGWIFVLQMIPIMIYLERKGAAFIQDRIGPNRAYIPGLGLRLAGMVHALADVVKIVFKEDLVPRHVNRFYYLLAPGLAMFTALLVGAVIPYAHPIGFADGSVFTLQGLDLGVGILFMLAVSSVAVYAVALAGWASNNKYSQLGGLRASANMISYEINLGLSIVGILLVYNSPSLTDMVAKQADVDHLALGFLPRWGVLLQPVGFVIYLISAFAETNRNPFDLVEGEAELVAGFHTEYGSFKFALFFMAEYVNIVIQSLVIVTLFFGGWQIPWVSHQWLAQPAHASAMLRVLLWLVAIGGVAAGIKLLLWHRKNRGRWRDDRKREGVVLSALLGFGPAVTAIIILSAWSGGLSHDGGAIAAAFIEFLTLALKTLFFCWLFIWVRWTTPRFRYDQLMGLGWKVLLPIGLANVFITALLVKAGVL
jgi:NADH-quinone oxidoreductase subunit H